MQPPRAVAQMMLIAALALPAFGSAARAASHETGAAQASNPCDLLAGLKGIWSNVTAKAAHRPKVVPFDGRLPSFQPDWWYVPLGELTVPLPKSVAWRRARPEVEPPAFGKTVALFSAAQHLVSLTSLDLGELLGPSTDVDAAVSALVYDAVMNPVDGKCDVRATPASQTLSVAKALTQLLVINGVGAPSQVRATKSPLRVLLTGRAGRSKSVAYLTVAGGKLYQLNYLVPPQEPTSELELQALGLAIDGRFERATPQALRQLYNVTSHPHAADPLDQRVVADAPDDFYGWQCESKGNCSVVIRGVYYATQEKGDVLLLDGLCRDKRVSYACEALLKAFSGDIAQSQAVATWLNAACVAGDSKRCDDALSALSAASAPAEIVAATEQEFCAAPKARRAARCEKRGLELLADGNVPAATPWLQAGCRGLASRACEALLQGDAQAGRFGEHAAQAYVNLMAAAAGGFSEQYHRQDLRNLGLSGRLPELGEALANLCPAASLGPDANGCNRSCLALQTLHEGEPDQANEYLARACASGCANACQRTAQTCGDRECSDHTLGLLMAGCHAAADAVTACTSLAESLGHAGRWADAVQVYQTHCARTADHAVDWQACRGYPAALEKLGRKEEALIVAKTACASGRFQCQEVAETASDALAVRLLTSLCPDKGPGDAGDAAQDRWNACERYPAALLGIGRRREGYAVAAELCHDAPETCGRLFAGLAPAQREEAARLAKQLCQKTGSVIACEQETQLIAAATPDPSGQVVLFLPGSAQLNSGAKSALAMIAAYARKHPANDVVLVGYAAPDEAKALHPDTDPNNLAARREQAVRSYLINQGIAPTRLSRGTPAQQTADSKAYGARVDVNFVAH